jgi:hypothetical protein
MIVKETGINEVHRTDMSQIESSPMAVSPGKGSLY